MPANCKDAVLTNLKSAVSIIYEDMELKIRRLMNNGDTKFRQEYA